MAGFCCELSSWLQTATFSLSTRHFLRVSWREGAVTSLDIEAQSSQLQYPYPIKLRLWALAG